MINFGTIPNIKTINSTAEYNEEFSNFITQSDELLVDSTGNYFMVSDSELVPKVEISSPSDAEVINFVAPIDYSINHEYYLNDNKISVYDQRNKILYTGWNSGDTVSLVLYNSKLYYTTSTTNNILYMKYKIILFDSILWDETHTTGELINPVVINV